MKVVALISGGKDSCYVMMKCIQYGQQIVALANLLPTDDSVDELDSHMYPTVGHQIVVSCAECMGLPLFRRRIKGSSRHRELSYKMTPDDEVEDLFILLNEVKRQIPTVTAVSSGAIASDYQRLRVESECLFTVGACFPGIFMETRPVVTASRNGNSYYITTNSQLLFSYHSRLFADEEGMAVKVKRKRNAIGGHLCYLKKITSKRFERVPIRSFPRLVKANIVE